MNNSGGVIELGERVVSAMYQENVGHFSKRQHYIAELAFDAKMQATQKPFELCDFKNKYGWCKLDALHEGSHTVVFMGPED